MTMILARWAFWLVIILNLTSAFIRKLNFLYFLFIIFI